ncbi:hypothetical protein CONPUDRAFT_134549 [Coniophora puteana RWD-64-598 SS2]|uniref:Glycosyltransferase family 32 protein n=1 Tax=Coniophora puteana (strain RWD-64-598) TaxID=741705 RepID=A0A5M3N7C7_CONPW|nr:uncharacterized protein CONPUDRAFT_134549 [Coniophora puteana RWD-64-598 SS2]EIW87349.1 hypothetical protein CONPUDRAFT_134549 [Coniophora puteana RWD-64-598 SS2]
MSPYDEDGLPTYSSAISEKIYLESRTSKGYWTPRPPSIRLYLTNPRRLTKLTSTRITRRKSWLLFLVTITASLCFFYLFDFPSLRRDKYPRSARDWPGISVGFTKEVDESASSTLVFEREEIQRIWQWEIESGHFPSNGKVPEQVGLSTAPLNPALPPRRVPTIPSRFRPPPGPVATTTRGDGPKRVYYGPQFKEGEVAYPPRPVPGGIADLDVIMQHCDFELDKYVRDCLEVLRVGAGLNNGRGLRRAPTDEWNYVYLHAGRENFTEPASEIPIAKVIASASSESTPDQRAPSNNNNPHTNPNAGFVKKKDAPWEPALVLSDPAQASREGSVAEEASAVVETIEMDGACDPENPHVFHMFWTGPFTDKPYASILSFLFTQNLGLHLPAGAAEVAGVCRPQYWIWINPEHFERFRSPAAARAAMLESLETNPWSAPFLDGRFRDAIKFKMWNTTEQLDSIPEIKDDWRAYSGSLLNSGGHIIDVAPGGANANANNADEAAGAGAGAKAKSEEYDKGSVVLSDMARFVLCHRFGGIYVDADTLFLRDWSELFHTRHAFAYRWSRLDKYNTAVLRLNRRSALGSWLFRTAFRNNLDFHPMTVTQYAKDAYLDALLRMLPDALFDSAWLNTEEFQRDRPPQPYFVAFDNFFHTPASASAQPQALGFEGFFRGAYSYHFHNSWFKPFDVSRNWPDLGARFVAGERAARQAADPDTPPAEWADRVADDKRDLDWATVVKRTFEAYVRGERPNAYGEWLAW